MGMSSPKQSILNRSCSKACPKPWRQLPLRRPLIQPLLLANKSAMNLIVPPRLSISKLMPWFVVRWMSSHTTPTSSALPKPRASIVHRLC